MMKYNVQRRVDVVEVLSGRATRLIIEVIDLAVVTRD